jgi:HEAT repeat protein
VALLARVLCACRARAAEGFVDAPEVLRLATVARGPGREPERLAALQKLKALGPEASAAAPALIALTSDPLEVRTKTRNEALSALAFMAPAYDTVIPAMIGQLSLDDGYEVMCALMKIRRPAVKPLLAAAQSRMDTSARKKALEALGLIADPSILRPLARLVAVDKSRTLRSEAAEALGGLGEAAAPAAGVIATQFARGHIGDGSALIALGRIGPKARSALPLVVKRLEADDDTTAALAAYAFFRIAGGEKGRGVLEKKLKGALAAVAHRILCQIMETGPPAEPAVPAVLGVLRDRQSKVRTTAARALGGIGLGTPEVLAALREARDSEASPALTRFAIAALALCGEVDRSWVRLSVTYLLSRGGVSHHYRQLVRARRPAVKHLVEIVNTPGYPPVKKWIAVNVLRDIGPDAAEALPALEARLAERAPGQKHSWRDAIPEAIGCISGKPVRRRR